jgi:sugar phosphate isomerase/epimerase
LAFSITTLALNVQNFREDIQSLTKYGIEGLEVAPTQFWSNPLETTKAERREFFRSIQNSNLQVIGLQSLLYGRPDLELFGSQESRSKCQDYLIQMTQLCADLGGHLLSFGSAKNRQTNKLTTRECNEMATDFFHSLADYSGNYGVTICIEPIAKEYNCNFINTANEGAKFVHHVNHQYIGLLLDSGNMLLNAEPCSDMVKKHIDSIKHFHANDPWMHPPSDQYQEHHKIAGVLSECYSGWITFEFLKHRGSFDEEVARAVQIYDITSSN